MSPSSSSLSARVAASNIASAPYLFTMSCALPDFAIGDHPCCQFLRMPSGGIGTGGRSAAPSPAVCRPRARCRTPPRCRAIGSRAISGWRRSSAAPRCTRDRSCTKLPPLHGRDHLVERILRYLWSALNLSSPHRKIEARLPTESRLEPARRCVVSSAPPEGSAC
jgi:hypothetical protein